MGYQLWVTRSLQAGWPVFGQGYQRTVGTEALWAVPYIAPRHPYYM